MSNNPDQNNPLPSIQTADPVKLLSSGIQIYFPLTKILQIGVLFETTGLIKIYIQLDAVTEDILIQIKVIELNTPISLAQLFFNLGLAHFYSQQFMILIESLKSSTTGKVTKQIQANLEETLRKIKELNDKPK